jgi:hypothetical protein
VIIPNYDQTEIESNPTWHLAWVLSELLNDNAPIGWQKYIWVAECLLATFDITKKEPKYISALELQK